MICVKAPAGADGYGPSMHILDLLPKYEAPVPRYTSYPTAPHFSPAVNAATYADWLRGIGDVPVSLYIHVPFCAQLCWFCGCHTTAIHSTAPVEAYAQTLMAEIDLLGATIGRKLNVAHIHWGGGTPTAMPPACMIGVMDHLRQHFNFLPDAEIAVEIDPRTATPEALDGLAAMGCTRASLGVQDFDERVQKAVNRMQSFEDTRRCAEALRERGINAINLDLIYGLPFQTEASVTTTTEQALALNPDRIAVFGYAHVPWMKKHQNLLPDDAMPGTLERWRQRTIIDQVIVRSGWQAIGLTDEDRLRRDVIEQLMCNGTVDLDETASRYGVPTAGLLAAAPALDGMAQDGIVEWDGRNLHVPDGARPFVRNVAAAFDTYFTPAPNRHARAV